MVLECIVGPGALALLLFSALLGVVFLLPGVLEFLSLLLLAESFLELLKGGGGG